MERPRNTILIAIVVIAAVVFAGLNTLMNRVGNGPTAESQTAQENTSSEATKTQPTPDGDAGPPVTLPQDQSTGPADAKVKIVVGWTWTPEVQGNPQALQNAIKAIRMAAPQAQIRVVNVDAVPEVSPGVQVNGQTVIELPENGVIAPGDAAQAVAGTVNTNR